MNTSNCRILLTVITRILSIYQIILNGKCSLLFSEIIGDASVNVEMGNKIVHGLS